VTRTLPPYDLMRVRLVVDAGQLERGTGCTCHRWCYASSMTTSAATQPGIA